MPALVGRGLGLSLLATYASATSTLRLNNTYPLSIEFATLACVGHLSRLGVGDHYTLGGNGAGSFPASTDVDELWLATLYNQTASDDVDLVAFVTGECRDAVPAVVRFDYETQREFLPQLLTAAIALDAVPLAVGDDLEGPAPLIVLDAVVEWAGLDNRATVEYVLDAYQDRFTSNRLVKINPGYTFTQPLEYSLTKTMDLGVVDFAVKERLFTFFLPLGCVPTTDDHALHERIVRAFNPGGVNATAVFGYDNSVPVFGGDTYEAETNCVKEHDLGQVASEGVYNVGYYSKTGPIDDTLAPNPTAPLTYSANKTFVAFIVGDGDNFWHLKYIFPKFFDQRVDNCAKYADGCYPLSWTVSPRAGEIMPDIVRQFHATARATANDYFVLPPSGSLYSYPGLMTSAGQDAYIGQMEADLAMFGTRCSVHWEWFYAWRHAISTYFSKWAAATREARGFVLTNVPYLLPAFVFRGQDFRVVGDNIVLFKPNEWRYSSQAGSHTTEEMGDLLNGMPRGTITPVYMTADGSLQPIEATLDLVQNYLEDHIELVSMEGLLDAALQKHNAQHR